VKGVEICRYKLADAILATRLEIDPSWRLCLRLHTVKVVVTNKKYPVTGMVAAKAGGRTRLNAFAGYSEDVLKCSFAPWPIE